MNREIAQAMSQSPQDFLGVAWPRVSTFPLVGGGTIRPVEAVATHDFKDELDLLAGMDAWRIDPETPMVRGLASRVQWSRAHDTFSIRYRVASGRQRNSASAVPRSRTRTVAICFPT